MGKWKGLEGDLYSLLGMVAHTSNPNPGEPEGKHN